MPSQTPSVQRQQLQEQRRKVDFDSYDVTVDELVRRVSTKKIELAPSYQRRFRWDTERQSHLVESLLLGIPIPPLFMATNVDANSGTRWEVVDGLQRLLSLTNFLGDEDTRNLVELTGRPLRLHGLQKLDSLEGSYASDLPTDLYTSLLDRPIKVIVLNDKSDLQVRFDLFERLNTGGIKLSDQEVRACVYMGPFIDLLTTLSESATFKRVVKLSAAQEIDGTAEEYVLRFFAFKDRYQEFDHSVKEFLNEYCASVSTHEVDLNKIEDFHRTFNFLAQVFPLGLRSSKRITPVNLFEGVAVGAFLALEQNPLLIPHQNPEWINSEEIKRVTTGATNDRKKVAQRIEISRDNFLNSL